MMDAGLKQFITNEVENMEIVGAQLIYDLKKYVELHPEKDDWVAFALGLHAYRVLRAFVSPLSRGYYSESWLKELCGDIADLAEKSTTVEEFERIITDGKRTLAERVRPH